MSGCGFSHSRRGAGKDKPQENDNLPEALEITRTIEEPRFLRDRLYR